MNQTQTLQNKIHKTIFQKNKINDHSTLFKMVTNQKFISTKSIIFTNTIRKLTTQQIPSFIFLE